MKSELYDLVESLVFKWLNRKGYLIILTPINSKCILQNSCVKYMDLVHFDYFYPCLQTDDIGTVLVLHWYNIGTPLHVQLMPYLHYTV